MRRLKLIPLLLPIAFVLAAGQAAAQGIAGLSEGDEPLAIEAEEGIEWNRDARTYVARGKAVARRGEVSLHAEVLTAYYREAADGSSEIYRIDATGGVIIATPNERIYGEEGVYSVEQGVARLTGGNLRAETAEQQLTARDSLEYWENYQGHPVAVARGDAVVVNPREGQRLRADVLTATLASGAGGKSEVRRVDAFGNVEIATRKEVARGERGVYHVPERKAFLEGNVQITQGKSQLSGDKAEVDLESGISRLLAGGGPVQVLLAPAETKPPEAP